MNECITNIISYPINYINKIKQLKKDQILLKNTSFYPAYPFLLSTSILCNLMLSIWMICYYFNAQIHQCYSGVTLGIKILSCVYPLYQLIIFLILIISIASNEGNCWKIFIFPLFSIITTSFGFGGLGVVYICMVHYEDPLAISSSFLTQNYFIQIIVYAMLVFIFLYILVVPFTSWLQSRRDPQIQRTDCEKCLCVFHCFFQIILFLGTLIFLGIILGGIPVLFYLLSGLTSTSLYYQREFLGFSLTCIIAPPVIFIIVYMINKFVGCGQDEMQIITSTKNNEGQSTKVEGKELESVDEKQLNPNKQVQVDLSAENTHRQVLLNSIQSKQFRDEEHQKVQKSKSKIKK